MKVRDVSIPKLAVEAYIYMYISTQFGVRECILYAYMHACKYVWIYGLLYQDIHRFTNGIMQGEYRITNQIPQGRDSCISSCFSFNAISWFMSLHNE
jgi:hypothetical protein